MTNDVTRHSGEPNEDDILTHLLRGFMAALHTYLDSGGTNQGVERIANRAAVGVVVLMILWPAERAADSVVGILVAAAKQLWRRRSWLFL